jgi:sorbitol-specific phosphotransferase system component IIA
VVEDHRDQGEAAFAAGLGAAQDIEAEAVLHQRGPARVLLARGLSLGLGDDLLAVLRVGGEASAT